MDAVRAAEGFKRLEKIEKGWSGDQKWRVEDENGEEYLLRITKNERAITRAENFEYQKRLYSLGVPMPEPIEAGYCDEGAYTLERYLRAKDAEETIRSSSSEKKYEFGVQAGRILRTIHSVEAPEKLPDWEARFGAKIDRKIKLYRECPIKFEGAERIIDYLNSNRALLSGRRQTLQHGDYHIGNMMILGEKLFVIDFDRIDFGDPEEEFNRIVWCAAASPEFASGRIDGYFEGDFIPADFFGRLMLYIGSNTLSSIPWAIPFGEGEIETMKRQAAQVLDFTDGFTRTVPRWYCGKKAIREQKPESQREAAADE